MRTERDFGRAYAEAMRGEPGFDSPVDVEAMATSTVSIPDGDYRAMVEAGIADPDCRKYWAGFNEAVEAD